ncbi:hypothetical protein PAHA111176_22140 [Parendozoicomonas haliclonae]|uniref:Uncharacterized protein n=2 Tax=Parendozoicomonas haliclonae TaxID=1960125 RepID=A0A1X7AQS8_9GAMM|nr:hypothetical protein EHSB41UT_04473 [Parendozoicomonas haliclonae]
MDVSGTLLELSLPQHKSDTTKELTAVRQSDIHNFSRYEGDSAQGDIYLSLLARSWKLNGPLFHQKAGELFLFCGVQYFDGGSQEHSLFQYEVLENVVLEHAKKRYGTDDGDFYHGQQRNSAPHDWKVVQINDEPAIQYNVLRDYGRYRYLSTVYPISHNHYLRFELKDNSQLLRDRGDEPVVDSGPIDDFFSQIVQSITIKLSDVAQAQREVISNRYPEQKYTSSREPEKWATAAQDAEFAEHCQWQGQLKGLMEARENGTFER